MNCEYELGFLYDVLKKCHIRTSLLSINDTLDALLDSWVRSIIRITPGSGKTIKNIVGSIDDTTKYKFTNELRLQYIFLQLPHADEKNLLFIGPYLSAPLSSKDILEIGEQLDFPPNTQHFLKDYYAALPIILENDHLFTVIDAFLERLWKTPSFSIVEFNNDHTLTHSPLEPVAHGNGFDEILAAMEQMEIRYAFENELILAVTMGQQHKERMLLSVLNEQMFEKRVQDPLRNAKNYCIIMNTLLRKAAEQGGVHPLHIDRMSSKFASKIELVTNLKAIPEFMREMFSSYCRLVRKHSTKQYSTVVKNTVLIIDSDISAELSLQSLAERLGVTAGYLATVFKKETGKTVVEYVRDKRINHALHLLNTTNLQIQTIAMHCGIMDVQYFSKLFKRQIGKTPREYREQLRR
jgi:AraC-like DNA-binding protein